MSVKKEREKLIKKVIKSSEKKGANISKILKGRTIEDLINLSKRNFDRLVQVIKERPQLEKELNKYEEKRINRQFKKIIGKDVSNLGLKDLIKEVSLVAKSQIDKARIDTKNLKMLKGFETRKNFPQFQPFTQVNSKEDLLTMTKKLENEDFKKNVELYVSNYASDFFYKYFNELTVSPHYMDRIDVITNYFGTKFDKVCTLIEIVTKDDFKVYTDGNTYLKTDDPESYYTMMINRLEKVEQLLLTL